MSGKKHKWGHWQSLVLNGRLRKQLERPPRVRVLMNSALDALGLRYRQFVPFMNPHHNAVQWLDYCVWSGNRMFVVFLSPYYRSVTEPERIGLEHKQRFLRDKGIPYVVVPRTWTSQLYATTVKNFIRKEAL